MRAPDGVLEARTLQAQLDRAAREVPGWESIIARGPFGSSHPRSTAPFFVREREASPRFSTRALQLDPYSLEVLRAEGYEQFTPGRRVRTWIRFLHTGEALGVPGQLAALTAAMGALVLAYSGVALSVRRASRYLASRRSRDV